MKIIKDFVTWGVTVPALAGEGRLLLAATLLALPSHARSTAA
jgi:hypothetical protein